MKQTDILGEIKMRLDIIELISEYVPLKKAGANYKGLCPFHSEKTPSFTVSPSRQFYYCFGCGEGGDVITFIKKIENLTLHETIEKLARRVGIEYTPSQISSYENRKRSILLSILKEAGDFYRKSLRKASHALDYLLSTRSLTEESINRFSIGYAPSEWDSLLLHLKGKGYTEDFIKDAGLLSYSEKGSYDLFRNRIIFPIHTLQEEIIGFGGRVMDDSLPKYINSPETLLFKKGETLFGLFQAKDYIKKLGYAIITEGYLDVIMCHQSGFKNVVAPLGTALTERQIRVLKKLTDQIILLYDGDQAGIAATKRAIPILLKQSLRPLVVLLPKGEDPDSFLRKNPPSMMEELLRSPLGLVEFYSKTSQEINTDTLRELMSLIAILEDPLMKGEYIRKISEVSGLKEEFLIEEIKRQKKQIVIFTTKKKMKAQKSGTVYQTTYASPSEDVAQREVRSQTVTSATKKVLTAEFLLIATVLQFPQKAGLILNTLRSEDIENHELKQLYFLIKNLYNDSPEIFEDTTLFHILTNLLSEDEMLSGLQSLVAHLTFNTHLDHDELDRLISDCLRHLRLKTMDRLIDEAKSRNDITLLNSLVKERAKIC